jgi:hypothetical protein
MPQCHAIFLSSVRGLTSTGDLDVHYPGKEEEEEEKEEVGCCGFMKASLHKGV